MLAPRSSSVERLRRLPALEEEAEVSADLARDQRRIGFRVGSEQTRIGEARGETALGEAILGRGLVDVAAEQRIEANRSGNRVNGANLRVASLVQIQREADLGRVRIARGRNAGRRDPGRYA